MEIKAQLNNLRLAPRKVRAIANLVKGKKVSDALGQLDYFVRRPSGPVKKLINSAIANAENNFNMVKDNLFIKSIIVNEGIKLRRMRAKGFGRAAAIQKKTSHIRIILDEVTPGLRQEKRKSKEAHEDKQRDEREEVKQHEAKKPEVKRELGSKKGLLNMGKKMFQRKAV